MVLGYIRFGRGSQHPLSVEYHLGLGIVKGKPLAERPNDLSSFDGYRENQIPRAGSQGDAGGRVVESRLAHPRPRSATRQHHAHLEHARIYDSSISLRISHTPRYQRTTYSWSRQGRALEAIATRSQTWHDRRGSPGSRKRAIIRPPGGFIVYMAHESKPTGFWNYYPRRLIPVPHNSITRSRIRHVRLPRSEFRLPMFAYDEFVSFLTLPFRRCRTRLAHGSPRDSSVARRVLSSDLPRGGADAKV